MVLTYLPYETPDNQDLRVATYDTYAEAIGEAQKRGLALGIGDHNTSVRYRIEGEEWLGPHLFGPRAGRIYRSDEEARRREGIRHFLSAIEICSRTYARHDVRDAVRKLLPRETTNAEDHDSP